MDEKTEDEAEKELEKLLDRMEGEAESVPQLDLGDNPLLLRARLQRAEREVTRLKAWGLDLQRNLAATNTKFQEMAESESNKALKTQLEEARRMNLALTLGFTDLRTASRMVLELMPNVSGDHALDSALGKLQEELQKVIKV